MACCCKRYTFYPYLVSVRRSLVKFFEPSREVQRGKVTGDVPLQGAPDV
jgi:hypothetical protein